MALCTHPAAYGQEVPSSAPPIRSNLDERGVDIVTGQFKPAPAVVLTIGAPGAGGLSHVYSSTSTTGTYRGRIYNSVVGGVVTYRVTFGQDSIVFNSGSGSDSGANFTIANDADAGGAKLSRTLTTGTPHNYYLYTFTASDGMVATFTSELIGSGMPSLPATSALLTTIAMPDGEVTTLNYRKVLRSFTPDPDTYRWYARVQSVTNNYAYQIKYTYLADTTTNINNWYSLTGARAINNAIDYCNPTADTCGSFSQTWPSVSFSPSATVGPIAFTDDLGRVTTYTSTSVNYPAGGAGTGVTISATVTSGKVASWTNGSETYSYAYSDAGDTRTTTITGPLDYRRIYTSSISKQLILTAKSRQQVSPLIESTTTYTYDASNRLTRITAPEGNYINYTYDARGNVTLTRWVAKPGSGIPDITSSAAYDATCTIAVKCNKPNTTTDPLGKVTTYTYDATHGGLTKVTAPEPVAGAVKPETRYTYAQRQASVRAAVGSTTFVLRAPIWRLIGTSSCTSLASCAGLADEVKSAIVYQTASTSAGGNILPSTVSSGSGNGTLTATTTLTYDGVSNLSTVDGPIAGTADTTKYRYDILRRQIGIIGPDPDGAGPLKHRATRLTYNWGGQVNVSEQGTVNSQSDADWAAFAMLQQTTASYTLLGRITKNAYVSGGATRSVVQYSYDAAGRLDCTAQRMNTALYGSLPTDACLVGSPAGTAGYDRISRTVYFADGKPKQLFSRVGISATPAIPPILEAQYTYTANGQLATVRDPKNNLTTYQYDGHDRLWKTLYPSNTPGVSSGTDFFLYEYDLASRIERQRIRNTSPAQYIDFTYDALGRPLSRTRPEGAGSVRTEYAYDNLGRMLMARDVNPGRVPPTVLNTMTWAYDALGRPISRTDASGTMAYQYDLAGRRTRVTWPDNGVYSAYTYDVTGAMLTISDGNSAGAGITLATYSYDNLGRRTGIVRGNGTTASYTFDAAGRLGGITENLAGTANDVTKTFPTYSPAGQIMKQTVSNNAYVWNGAYLPTTTYVSNWLNQVTSFTPLGGGATTVTNDARGNLTADGSKTYTYNLTNQLKNVSGGVDNAYNPLGQLVRVYQNPVTTRFSYDGDEIAAEYDTTFTLLRRYVKGPGADETVVWYEGAGITNRRWLHADERGSIIAVTDASGAALFKYTYDEYGRPGPTNTGGRFQYTGQAWFGEMGLYYYKARFYQPTLGRFLQPDPIGYGDGLNMYAYVGGDPVNFRDPSGMYFICSYDWWKETTTQGGEVIGVNYTLRSQTCTEVDNGNGGNFGFGRAEGSGGDDQTGDASCSSNAFVGPVPAAAASVLSAEYAGLAALRSLAAVLTLPLMLSSDTSYQSSSQYVVRAGVVTADSLMRGTSVFRYDNREMAGFSVQSREGLSVDALAAGAPRIESYGQISYTTTAQLAAIGRQVAATPLPGQPNHATVIAFPPLSPADAQAIASQFRQKANPYKGKKGC